MNKLFVLLLLFFARTVPVAAQQIIFSETFTRANGVTSGTATGTPGGTWGVTNSPGGTFSVQGGQFRVDGNGSPGVWATNVIDISTHGYAIIETYLQVAGFPSANSYIRCSYSVDGGPEVDFAEISAAFLFNGQTVGSAIVSGNTLQLFIRGFDDSFLAAFAFDDVTITAANKLYSRKNGNWNDTSPTNGTWSVTSHLGAACGCSSNDRTVAIVGPLHTVSLTGNESTGGVSVKPTGVLRWTGANQALSIVRGLVEVDGEFNGAFNNANLVFEDGYAVDMEVSSTTSSINDMVVVDVPSVNIRGTGSFTMTDLLAFTTNVTTFTNDITLGFNTLSGGNFNSITLNNTGTINHTNAFTSIGTNASLINRTNGVWNYSGSVAPPAAVNLTAADNTFNYANAGAQTVRTGTTAALSYHHVRFTGSGTKSAGASINVNGNLSIENTATFAAANNTVTVGGNWSVLNTASFTEAAGTVQFTGANNATITHVSPDNTFYNLVLNKAVNTNTLSLALLAGNTNVSQTLTLTRGRLLLSGNTLGITRASNAAITGASANSYIVSEVNALPYSNITWNTTSPTPQAFIFPFGNAAGTYLPFYFNATNMGTGASRSVTVSTYSTGVNNLPFPDGVLHVFNALGIDISLTVTDRFWIITTNGYATSPTANVTFSTANSEILGITNPRAQRWNSTTKAWDAPLPSQIVGSSTGAVTVTVGGVSNFSPWTLAGAATPLPVSLTDFSVMQQGDEALLRWSTATELNNDYFDVERATLNLEKFTSLGRQAGNGTTNVPHDYSLIDAHPISGLNYYRLKQVDLDGKYVYSEVKVLNFDGNVSGPYIKIYPNPSRSQRVAVEINGIDDLEVVTLTILNMTGRTVFEKSYPTESAGRLTTDVVFDTPLPAGLYVIKASSVAVPPQKLIIE